MVEEQEVVVPKTFFLHNTTRSVQNRNLRAEVASTGRRRQVFIGDGEQRLLKGRPREVSAEWLRDHHEELRDKIAQGLLEVRTGDGARVDLETGHVDTLPAPPLVPSPPLDSANRDIRAGEHLQQMPGGQSLADLTALGGAAARDGIPGPKPPKDKMAGKGKGKRDTSSDTGEDDVGSGDDPQKGG